MYKITDITIARKNDITLKATPINPLLYPKKMHNAIIAIIMKSTKIILSPHLFYRLTISILSLYTIPAIESPITT